MSTESELRQAMSEQVASVIAPPDLLAGVRRRHRRRVVRIRVLTVVGLTASAVGVASVYGFVTRDRTGSVAADRGGRVTPPRGEAASCVADVPARVIPAWARTGFSDAEPRMPYVLGDRGDIVAILFGNPLAAPPRKDLGNKILWVSRASLVPGDPLVIDARLDGSRTPVKSTVLGGPGPSGLDLPQGCWHVTLKWSGHTDTLNLRYSPQPG